jgi:hypothetical protein
MTERPENPGTAQRGIIRAIALVCACMVFFAATLRVAHTHTPAERASGHCQVCIAIHTAMPAATAPIHVILRAAPEIIVTSAPQTHQKVRVALLSDRAPPVVA